MDISSYKMTSDEAKHTSEGARNELLEKAVCRHGLCVRLFGL